LDQRSWQAGPRAIEKDSHAQSLGALRSYQAHVPADMVDVVKMVQLGFIGGGIPFQARDSLFDRLAETRAYLKTVLGNATNSHGESPRSGNAEAATFGSPASSFS
jgi:hypothetical protein